MNPSPEEYAWFAGHFDGEGSIHAGKNYYLSTVSSDRDVIARIANLFGGNLREDGPGGLGNKRLYRWQLGRQREVNALMGRIYPWLSERRQAKWADTLEMRQQWIEQAPGNKFKTHCEAGHPLVRLPSGRRGCRICRSAYQQAWKRRKAATL